MYTVKYQYRDGKPIQKTGFTVSWLIYVLSRIDITRLIGEVDINTTSE